jgi:hypothetical protein
MASTSYFLIVTLYLWSYSMILSVSTKWLWYWKVSLSVRSNTLWCYILKIQTAIKKLNIKKIKILKWSEIIFTFLSFHFRNVSYVTLVTLAPNAALYNKQIIQHYFIKCVTMVTLAPNAVLWNKQIILHYFTNCVTLVTLAPNAALYNKQILLH